MSLQDEPNLIDPNGIKLMKDDDTASIGFSMSSTNSGIKLQYDLLTTPKEFSITPTGINWTNGVDNYTTALDRIALVQQAFQAVELPPNATTLQLNDTLKITDGTNDGTFGLNGTDCEITSTGDISLAPTGNNTSCNQKTLKQVLAVEGHNNTDLTIQANGNGDIVLATGTGTIQASSKEINDVDYITASKIGRAHV